ncbi:O-acetyl-ADP-ribose deacetylase (regulator of RNase III) [Actinomadura pelletieri DSM 43383]|uniref:O-acetyl-ADP-ribose deacetylase (Regulator of RNase III) n=1 Tax=Actinomadura pelletieri DSM 43383 TaxID=1120940 RepID=A0A495QUE3_9ACTN|nr:hypothetical protein [Actinomadura pelletieri]RKS77162.1 O-acetyl-ADP-ribose deacetylase (regulator of RNase III) [Actinomadura pelletieri DSM 43383]
MQAPAHWNLVADIHLLRRKGLTQVRDLPLAALDAVAAVCRHTAGEVADEGDGQESGEFRPTVLEEILREAVDLLGGGNLSTAAEYVFGLAEGTRDWPIGDRRKRAAAVYGISTERFRKRHEQLIVEQTAEAMLRLCRAEADRDKEGSKHHREPLGKPVTPLTVLKIDTGGKPLTLHVGPVELLRDVDVVVTSENTYLEMSRFFRDTQSAAVRRAGARLGESGEVLDDTVHRELTEWRREHGRIGLSVAPGTVAATGSGEMRDAGVRRVYHAAVAVPEAGGLAYRVAPDAVARAVKNVFRLAAQERRQVTPPLRSIAFPLFGAGRGGLAPEESFAWLWSSIERNTALRGDPWTGPFPWELHVITRSARSASAVLRAFGRPPL